MFCFMYSLGLKIEEELLENTEILLIIDSSTQYSHCVPYLSIKQAARLFEHKFYTHQNLVLTMKVKIPIGAIYKANWEEDVVL